MTNNKKYFDSVEADRVFCDERGNVTNVFGPGVYGTEGWLEYDENDNKTYEAWHYKLNDTDTLICYKALPSKNAGWEEGIKLYNSVTGSTRVIMMKWTNYKGERTLTVL